MVFMELIQLFNKAKNIKDVTQYAAELEVLETAEFMCFIVFLQTAASVIHRNKRT